MDDETIEVEAESVEEAERLIYAKVPDGCVADIKIVCDGRPVPRAEKTVGASANTSHGALDKIKLKIPEGWVLVSDKITTYGEESKAVGTGASEESAFDDAAQKLPAGANARQKRVVQAPHHETLTVSADDLAAAAAMAHTTVSAGATMSAEVSGGTLVSEGQRRLFGILGRSANTYQFDVNWFAKVEIDYRVKAVVSAVIGTDFYKPKARVVGTMKPSSEAEWKLRRYPSLKPMLESLPVGGSFFGEQYDYDRDEYVAPDSANLKTSGPIDMTMRIIDFMDYRVDHRHAIEGSTVTSDWSRKEDIVVAHRITHYRGTSGRHVMSMYVRRSGQKEYTSISGRFEKS